MTYTRSQQKVLAGMAVATAVVFEDHRRRELETPITGALLAVTGIATAAKLNEYRTYQALTALVARGDVVRDTLIGMGGGLSLYKLNDELRDAALARYSQEPVR